MAALKPLLFAIIVLIGLFSAVALQGAFTNLVDGQASSTLKPKVFIIGLSKTGTTSLGDALERLGYKRSGWEDLRSRWLYHRWARSGSVQALEAHTRRFDAFEDIPWPQVYREMAELYPTARFILSLRRDDDAWLRSCVSHTARRHWAGHRDVYGCLEAGDCPEQYRTAYRAHNNEVRRFFAARGEEHRLLEFVIDPAKNSTGGGSGGNSDSFNNTKPVDDVHPGDRAKWSMLVNFLNAKGELGEEIDANALGEFPQSNSKTSFNNRDPVGIYWSVDRLFFLVESALVNVFDSTVSRWVALRAS